MSQLDHSAPGRQLSLTATIVVSGQFTPEANAWPTDYSLERIAAETEALYRADPAALLEAFPLAALAVTCRPVDVEDTTL